MSRKMIALLMAVLGASVAHADDGEMTVVGGIDLGFKKLMLDTGAGDKFSPSFMTVNPNIVLGYKSVYAGLSYDSTVHAEHGMERDQSSGLGYTFDYDRSDTTFTLGYRLNQSFALFTGYTEGKNTFFLELPAVVLNGKKIDYKESGPFAGISYSATFGSKGTLGLSVGYAKLNGELTTVVFPSGVTGSVTGDATGYSYG